MKFFKKIQIVLVILALLIANLVIIPKVHAGTLTHSSVTEIGGASNATPMIASTGQAVVIAFTTPTGGGTSVSVNFGSWGGTVNATQTVSNTVFGSSCTAFTGATNPLPGSITAAGSGSTITISSVTALAAGQSYCTALTSTTAVTNPVAGVYPVVVTAGADSQTSAVDVLSSGANAYSITGTVAPTFTMSLSGTTDTFSGNLAAGSVTLSTGITTTINTNAVGGWFVWAEDSQAGLHSTTASKTIATVTTGSNHTMNSGGTGPGNEAYALGVSANNTANYAYGGGTTGGGLSTTVFNQIATTGAPASNVTFVTHELANISATTPPATDYTDIITEIGAGSF
jgi:hypothetical protein